MRLFTAIDLPENVVSNLEELLRRLRPTARLKWSPPSNLHITTRFIGEWPGERLAEIQAVLGALPPCRPISISIQGLGFFPNPRAPRVFWAGIQAPPELTALAAATDRALAPLGIEPEKRAFSPHLTLARIKEPVPLEGLRAAIAALPSLEFGSFAVDRFYLYQSRMHPSGSVYTKLSEYPLSK